MEKETNIYNADNKYRKMAIQILKLIDEKTEIDLCGKPYYELEDEITNLIKGLN